jgi:hypothetical protein
VQSFTTSREAKECIIAHLLEDTTRQGTELSETEWKMLYFSETGWTLPDMDEVSEVFDRDYNRDEYELKIGELAHRCFAHLRRTNRVAYRDLMQAEGVLKQEDHYLYVLINYDGVFGEPGPPTPWWLDRLKLVLTAAGVIITIMAGTAIVQAIFGFK